MISPEKLELPLRRWVPDWLGVVGIFAVMLPVAMLNGSYTGSMLEVSNTLGTNTEDITMGYYAASAGMAIAYPVIVKTCSDIFYTIGQKKCPMPSAKIRNYSHSHNLMSK